MASGLIYDDEGNDVTMDVLGQAVDDMDGPWMNPDCWNGKHQACAGDAWDDAEDVQTICQCPCHGPYDPDDWDADEDGPPVVDVPTGGYL